MLEATNTALWFAIPGVVFADLVSKFWARTTFVPPDFEIDLGRFLGLHLTENPGVSFGALDFGAGEGRFIPLLVTIALAGVVAVWMIRTPNPWRRLFVGFILAGAVGNIIDRLANGGVTDFLEYRWFGEALFVGNFADVSITIGAIGAFGSLLWAGPGSGPSVNVAQGEMK